MSHASRLLPLRERRWLRRALRVFLLALALPLAPRIATAVEPPDPGRLEELRSATAEWNEFRVTTLRGRIRLRSLVADPEGVRIPTHSGRAALISTPDAGRARLVAWSEIEGIEGRRTHVSGAHVFTGALLGAAVGLGASSILRYLTSFESEPDERAFIAPIVVGTVFGSAIGAAIPASTPWSRIVP